MNGILADKVVVLLSEGNIWKRIFGLDAQTLFDTCITLVAMLVLFMLLSYLLFNPARNLINKRRELIAGQMREAEKQKKEADAYKAEYDSKLKNVKSEADELMDKAKSRARKQETEIISEAKEEAGRIVKRAEKEAALEKSKAIDGMKQEIISVASLMAQKVVSETMDESKQNELLEAALKEMGEDTWQN